MNNSIYKFAALGGLVLIVYQFLLYLGGVEWMLKWPLALLHYVIIIAIMTIIVIRRKSLNRNEISLQNAFKTAFVSGVILTFFTAVYSFALFTFDSEIRDELKNSHKEQYIEMLRERNVDEEKIDSMILERDNQYAQRSVLMDTVYQWLIEIVIVAILSIIIAMVFKTPTKSLSQG